MSAPVGSPCRCGGTFIAYRLGTTKCDRCGTFEEGWDRRPGKTRLVAKDGQIVKESTAPIACEFCGETHETMFLQPRCHPTAPLIARLDGEVLTLSCYLPDCGREVVRFRAEVIKGGGR